MPLRIIDEARNREEGSVKDKSGKKKPGSPRLGAGMGRPTARAGLAGAIKRIKARASEARRDNAMGEKAKALTGGQAKIAAKAPPPNKIDEKDFAVLRAEKAKGRGQGLQDEKMKPGKIMKARAGKMFTKEQKQKYPGLAKAKSASEFLKRRKELTGHGKMTFDQKMKAQEQGFINKKTGAGAKELMKRASSVGLGKKLLLPVAAGVATVQYLKKKMKEKKENKKMGGGMMQRPTGYDTGGPASDEKKRRDPRGQQATRGLQRGTMRRLAGAGAMGKGKTPTLDKKKPKGYVIITGNSYDKARKEVEAEGGSPRLKTEDNKSGRVINKVFGNVRGRSEYAFQSGGMMKPMGYKAGKSVKVKCKLGRNKPTKMY